MRGYDGVWRINSRCNGRGADLWLAKAAIPCRSKHAGISRSDLSKSLYSDTWHAEEGADGTPAYRAADARKPDGRYARRADSRIHDRRYGLHPRAGRLRPRIARARPLGRRPARGSNNTAHATLSSAIRVLRLLLKIRARTRRPSSPRSVNTCANCRGSCAAP